MNPSGCQRAILAKFPKHSCWTPIVAGTPAPFRDGKRPEPRWTPLGARRYATMEPNESQKGEFSSLITGLKQKRPVSQAEIAEEKARLGSAGPVGQPTSLSHPHLLAPGETTPGIHRSEYLKRRINLMKAVPEGGIAIVGSYGVRYMTGGIFYPFRQNSDLLYLTGCEEPDCAIILIKHNGSPHGHRFIMFARPKDRSVEVWDGPRCGPEGCKALFGADEAHPIGTLQSFLDDLVKKTSKATSDGSVHIYTDLPVRVVDPSDPKSPGPRPPSFHTSYSVTDPSREDREACLSSFVRNLTVPEPILESGMSANETDEKSSGWWSFKGTAAAAKQAQRIFMRPLKSHLQELRLVKSDSEASMLLTAGNITGAGFREMFRSCRPGSTEHALYATFDGHTRQLGATRMAYVPVVASGRNALTLHYVHNRALLCEGDLVLVDAGIEYEGYVSDVTRTFPVSGRFTDPQRNLYQALLRVQKTCVAKCTESTGLSLDEIHSFSHSELRKELESLFGRYVTPREMDRLYPHHVGHWMGMDVHDSDGISRTRKLKKGMVVTIEPGVYVPDDATYPSEYRGLGMRIEDDVLVGQRESLALSYAAPKEVDEIEALMSHGTRK